MPENKYFDNIAQLAGYAARDLAELDMFERGFDAALEAFAIWKDGEQTIGSLNTPIKTIRLDFAKSIEKVKERLIENNIGNKENCPI